MRLLALFGVVALLAGCSSGSSEPAGYSKDDFKKTSVPAGYGPPGGKPATPPSGG